MATLKEVYDAFKADGAPLPDTYEEFENYMTSGPNKGYDHRKQWYDAFKADGAPLPDTYEEFSTALFKPVSNPATSEQSKQPEYFKLRRGGKDFTVSTDEVNAAGGLSEWAKANPGAPLRVYMQGNKEDGNSFYGHVDLSVAHDRKQKGLKYSIASKPIEKAQTPSHAPSQEPWKPTAQENAALSRKLKTAQAQADAMFDESRSRMEDLSEYYNNPSRFGFKSVESKPVINSEAGKLEKTYITPFGERVKGKETADKAAQQYRQAMIAADMTVGAQIRRAEYELQELQRQKMERSRQIAKDAEKADNGGLFSTYGRAIAESQGIQNDKELRAIDVAIHQKDEQLKNLREERDRQAGKDVGFWRGFGRAMGDIRTWDFGISDAIDAATMKNIDKFTGPDATEGERRAGQEMLKAIHDNQEVEREYGENASFWNRAGVMTGYMPSFMIDFALTGGGFEAINVAGKAAARGAVKLVGKETIEEMAKLGVKEYAKKYGVRGVGRMAENWTVKALGTTADELLIRAPLMTNTVQAGKTAADIIDRKLGDVIVDENGNYDFSNDKTWGSAVWQGEANAIIENYSEMFGAHLDGVAPALAKTFGSKRISGMLARANASSFGKILETTRKHFNKLGVSDYFGEVGEEYYGQLWRSMLNLDDAYQQNPDGTRTNLLFTGQFHGDIWGGMALSMGLMGIGKYGVSGIAYGSLKHQVNKADKRAAEIFTPDRWESIRKVIDNTHNEDMGALAEIYVNDPKLSDDECAAVMEYMESSLNLRGNNLGAMAQSRGTAGGVSPDIMVDSELSQSYMDGYEASTSQELNDAQNMYEYQRQRAEGMFDKSYLEALEQTPVYYLQEISQTGLFSQEEIDAALDYINAKTVRDGIIQRVNDNIDEQIAQSDAMINGRVNQVSGMIQPAVMGLDDRQVYVVGGSLVVNEDGSIDRDASDESIVVRDAVTGEIEFTDSKSIVSAGEAIDPEAEKAAAVDRIRQQAAQAAADALNGILPLNPGDVVQIDLGNGYVPATVVGHAIDEESGAPVEGQIIVQMADGQQATFTKEQLQAFADAANYERLNGFEQERAAARAQQQASEAEAMRPQFALNDEFTILNDAGTPIRGSITSELDEDGTIEIYTEEPINGNRINRVTPAELEEMLDSYNDESVNMPIALGEETAQPMTENAGTVINSSPTEAAQPITDAVDNRQEAPVMSAEATPLQRIPRDENGEPRFEQAESPEAAWDALVEFSEGDAATAKEIADTMAEEKRKAFEKAQKQKAKGKTPTEILTSKKEIAANLAQAEQEYNIWQQMAGVEQSRQETIRAQQASERAEAERAEVEAAEAEKKRKANLDKRLHDAFEEVKDVPEAVEMLEDMSPRDIYEAAAELLSWQKVLWGGEGGFKSETGYGEGERRKFLGLFASKDKGGMSLQSLAEDPMKQLCEIYGIPYDNQDARNALIDVIGGALTIGDIRNYIANNRISEARKVAEAKRRYDEELYDEFCQNEYHMSRAEVEAYEEILMSNIEEIYREFDENEYNGYIADEMAREAETQKLNENARENIAARRTSSSGNRGVQENDTKGTGDISWRSDEVLPESRSDKFSGATADGGRPVIQPSDGIESNGTASVMAQDASGAEIASNDSRQEGEIATQNKLFNYFAGPLRDLIELAKGTASGLIKKIIAPISERLQQDLASYGIDVSADYKHVIDNNAIRHALKNHGGRQEEKRGQIPLTDADFERIEDVVTGYNSISIEKGKRNDVNIVYSKSYADGTTIFVEEKRDGRKELAAITMWKKKNSTHTDANHNVTPISDSSEVSERKVNNSATEKQVSGAESFPQPSDNKDAQTVQSAVEAASAQVNTEPTPAQAEAGNYKKGHVTIGEFDITIENPAGSVRSGVDADGKEWETTMQNTYGYIRGTEGVDGDHIDVFLSNDIDAWNGRKVFVVDQTNADGSFDEHKVMIGFNDKDEAMSAYLANYDKTWADTHPGIRLSETNIEDFNKWVRSSHRKTKPFADYSTVSKIVDDAPVRAQPQQPLSLNDMRSSIEEISASATADDEAQQLIDAPVNPSGNRLVSDERYAELRERMRKKLLGQANMGMDPEILAIGTEMAVYHIEKGARKFAAYASAMIADLGDAIRPYLKSFYNAVRDMPEAEDAGLVDEMDSYDDVRRVDIANFDKTDAKDIIATAEHIVRENQSQQQTEEIIQSLKDQRNEQRKKEADETSADTQIIVSKAEAVASKIEIDLENARTEQDVEVLSQRLDKEIENVNEQLALLGYYEYEEDDSKFHESYGYMLTAEKKAIADATNLSKQLVKDLGIDIKVTSATTPLGRKSVKDGTTVRGNLAPAGGEIYITLPLNEGRELAIWIDLEPVSEQGSRKRGDNLEVERIMYRVEWPNATGHTSFDRIGRNCWAEANTTYDELLTAIRREVRHFLPNDEVHPATQLSPQPGEDYVAMAARVANDNESRQTKIQPEQTMSDLFSGFLDARGTKFESAKEREGQQKSPEELLNSQNKKSKNNSDERTDIQARSETTGRGRQQPRPDESLGKSAEHENERTDRRGVAQRGAAHTMSDTGRGSGVSRLSESAGRISEASANNTRNNHAERGTDYAPKGEKARIDANIAAIELAKRLLDNGASATPAEMAVLRRYSGWGGLGSAFNEGNSWSPNPINKRLRELLTPEEYDAAVMSRNSAYYTPAPVIDAMWDVVKALGFNGGNILEGSAGIGNIIGLMPTDISERSSVRAVEVEPLTGGILSLLYPDAKVDIQGFEKAHVPNGSIDLAITNVPFVTGLHVKDESGDADLSKKFRDIHDFCIAKNVRKLREGGIGIFITSSGTLDKSQKLRNWLVGDKEGCADVIGAFRLNNQTFGGTPATSDIIVVRKRVNGRRSANAIDVSSVAIARTAPYENDKGKIKDMPMLINRYFIEHPEYMGGEMYFGFERGDTYRPTSTGLFPVRGADQSERLSDWVNSFSDKDWSNGQDAAANPIVENVNEALGENVKEGGMVLDSQGRLCIARMGRAVPIMSPQAEKGKPQKTDGERIDLFQNKKIKGRTKAECFKDYSEIKDALAEVLKYQTEHDDDAGLRPLLDRLNHAYDVFVARYGYMNRNKNLAWLRNNDIDYSGIAALETVSERGSKFGKKEVIYGKTDIFNRRVVDKETEPKPQNIKDGIIASLYKYGRIDLEYLAEQLGKSQELIRKEIVESGLGFENPTNGQTEVSYEYLSGNVREKLRQANEANESSRGAYDANIKALESVVPMNIPAHLIEFTLGSSWISPKLYERYIKERTDLDVKLTNAGGTWHMNEPWYTSNPKNNGMGIRSEKLDILIPGHKLIDAAITNKPITVSKSRRNSDGSTETVTDQSASAACTAKVDEIRQDFKDWARAQMQADPDMSVQMEEIYNERFNNSVPKEIPDEFVPEHFGGAATTVAGQPFSLRPHQAKAVIRATTQPVMLAHEVGTGKTYTLITTAMEMRRLGTARKPMIVVQNATVGQFVASAKALYPNAKILTLEDADRNEEGRKAFYAKIKFNDWDMIVVPQSVAERIPDSIERQARFIQDTIDEKLLVLEQMKDADPDGKSQIVRAAEREIEKLNDEIAQLGNGGETNKKKVKDQKKAAVTRQNAEVKAREMLDRVTDDVEDFDSMGIDALLVDEAHEYKHLGFATAMQRGVKGVDSSFSKKSQGIFLKVQSVLEKTGGKNVVFATGTPISNTAAEIWTFMRYLMPADTMKDYGIYYFDDFVRNFGNLQQMLEFGTNGKYKENNRFAGYVNLPELVRIWSTVADTVLTREAGGVSDKIPRMEGDKAQDIFLPQTRALRAIMKYVKSRLDQYDRMSGKEKKENSHIPLVMYGIAKAAAVDARLVQADAEDDPMSKTNEAVRQTLRSLESTKEYNGTVAIFADNYQNKTTGFNLYEDIRKKLIDAGVAEEQIVIMKSGMTVKKKLEIFEKVNAGEIRVIMGSTFTLGTGVNIQERLHTLIHLDAPNRPMDYTQRNGRILRQGNLHRDWDIPVRVLRFGVEDSLDVTAYQRLKTKGAIADSIMDGKRLMNNSMETRTLEEEQDLFGDITAQLSGSEYALLKNQIEKEVRKLTAKLKAWGADQTYIHNRKRQIAGQNKASEKLIANNKAFLDKIEDATVSDITVGKLSFPGIDAMDEFFKEQNKKKRELQEHVRNQGYISRPATMDTTVSIGGFDFKIHTEINKEMKQGQGTLFASAPATMTYSCPELGIEAVPVRENLIKNAVAEIMDDVISGKDFRDRIEAAERSVERNNAELKSMEARDGVPFQFADELAKAKEKLDEYDELMKEEMAKKEAKYAELDKDVEAATEVTYTEEDSEEDDNDIRYREVDDDMIRNRDGITDIEEVNRRFNEELQQQINGELPQGHIYQIGKPGEILRGAGFPDAPIELSATRLAEKAAQRNHQFDIADVKNLPAAIQKPIAVFAYGDKTKSENVIVGLDRDGKQFVVGVFFNQKRGGVEVSSVRGIFNKDNAEWLNWISQGKSVYLDKEKIQALIDQQRTNLADVEYLDLEDVTKVIKSFENPTIADNESLGRQGDGYGAYSDEEVSYANDPISMVTGKNRFSKKRQSEFAERERQRMVERVKELAERMHLDNVEIVIDTSQLDGKRATAKGFFNKRTGKITIIIPNNISTLDVKQTLLHEAVAHYGLRQLFGEHFDTFLDNVYESAEPYIRRKIADMAAKNGWDFRIATEEYLAGLAEDTNFNEPWNTGSWWQKIKNLFIDMLEKIGFDGFRDKAGIILSDNELRYILWRSYENLAEPGRYRSILGEAADVVKQEHLGVGNYAQSKIIGVTAAEPGLHDKRVVNVFINSSEAPKTRAEALSMLDKMTQPFHNDDQDVDIYVSHRDARHTMQFHNHDQVSLISGIGDLIKHAVKVGEVPVAADEVHTTKAVHIYYGAVNIGGRQYSARLTVKEYYEGSRELNELHLYNALLKKHQANTLSHDGTPHMRPDAKERYKISELIDNTQKNENEFDNIDEYISVH